MRRVLVLNGPNLGTLGRREPDLYGTRTLRDIEALLEERAPALDLELRCEQSNHEGRLIDILEEERDRAAGAIYNFGALTHTSIALHDALVFFAKPAIEVHLTNIHARERFRHRSVTAAAARGIVAGLGADGYVLALAALARILDGHDEGANPDPRTAGERGGLGPAASRGDGPPDKEATT